MSTANPIDARAGTPARASWLTTPTGMVAVLALLTVARLAMLASATVPLYGDEAQYWDWSRDPAFGYFSKPPVIAWLIAMSTALFGDTEFGIRAGMPIVHAVTGFMIYLIGRRLFNARVGFWSGLGYATLPAVSVSTTIASTDPPLLMFWSIALYAFIRAVGEGPWRWWLLSGAALGLAMMSKYAAMAFFASALLYLLLSPDARRWLATPRPYAMAAAAVLVFLPNIVWNLANGFVTVRHVAQDAELGDGLTLDPLKLLEFLAGQYGVFGPILFGALTILLARWRSETRDDRMLLLLAFVVPMLLAMTVQSLLAGANANWAAASYVAATVAVTAALATPRWRRLLVASLALHLVIAAAVPLFDPVWRATGLADTAGLDPYKRLRGWPEVGERLATLREEYPGTALLSEERRMLVQYLYYAAVPREDAYKWNPFGRIDDHYDLVSDLTELTGRDVLYVTRHPVTGPLLAPCAASVEALPPIQVATHADLMIDLSVFLLTEVREGLAEGRCG